MSIESVPLVRKPTETLMRKLILKMDCSLDGFVCGKDGDLDWLLPGLTEEHAECLVPKLWEAGAHLMGSVTYRGMAAHWPTSTEPYALAMNQIPKVVFSANSKQIPWGEVQIVPGDPAREVKRMKCESGKPLLAHGGARLAHALIRAELIDEYWLVGHPVVLGSGLRLFPEMVAPMRLRLVSETTFTTGVMAKIYQPSVT